MDKETLRRVFKPKGEDYCNTKNTYCIYDKNDICVNCGRKKGWRFGRV